MSKISKINAFKTMVEYIDCNKSDTANEIFKIINRSQIQDKKNNIISNYIQLRKKEERYFETEFIIEDKDHTAKEQD